MNYLTKFSAAIAMSLMIIGVVLFLVVGGLTASYVFIAGAVIFAIERFVVMSKSDRTKSRLPQIQMLSSICLLLAGYMMYTGSNSWSVMFLISAVIEVYATFRAK